MRGPDKNARLLPRNILAALHFSPAHFYIICSNNRPLPAGALFILFERSSHTGYFISPATCSLDEKKLVSFEAYCRERFCLDF